METAISTLSASVSEREHSAIFQTYERLPIGTIDRAEGCYIYTQEGEQYLDLIAGLGVSALGHSHPAIVSAITEQANRYLHLSNLFLQEPQVALAEKLKALSGFDKVFFCNSGTEAVEGALKLSRRVGVATGKFEIIGLANAFHGRTFWPLSIMDNAKYREGIGPFVPGMHCVSPENLSSIISEKTAAIIIEVIQGEGGIRMASKELIAELEEAREKYGCLIIADEIQSGIGRTGTFFAYEQFGLKPDIVVVAKAIGGGLPLGGILTSNVIASVFAPGTHGTTFGGNSLSCVAGSVVLDEIQNGLLDSVSELSEWFITELNILKEQFPEKIKEIRGKGFMLGIDLAIDAKQVNKVLLEQRIIANVTAGSVLRLLPPLTIKKEQLKEFIGAFSAILH
jgi:acetylornithine/N-succinyldiaminopimelate aminotransferase